MSQSPDISRAPSTLRVLARFAVRIALLATFAAFGSIGFGKSLSALLWMSIILCAVVGLIRREPPFRAALNHWDEAVAFGALFALVHTLDQLI
ncbi:hypothetical protein [Bradyrhizobium sp. Cp5.3]|uniref:hypothetical protein n=1 Tax=Bradyrhizobium sp. Cp5.3 TaxID=443598 RepID=UPI000413A320|nr:hypothetical protein [Bradyrhizobium sp. Cp5.3]